MTSSFNSSLLGAGLRSSHYPDWYEQKDIPILEVMSDNFMFCKGGPPLYHLQKILEQTRVVVHGIGLDVANAFSLNLEYCAALKEFYKKCNPLVVSDHLCFSATPSHNSFDLLPFPYHEDSLKFMIERIRTLQDVLDRQFCLENVSSYVSYKDSCFSEIEFLNLLCNETGCGVLFDINNLYVNSQNHKFDPVAEIEKLNSKHVKQYHLSGHSVMEIEEHQDSFLFDTHDTKVCDPVWKLFEQTVKKTGMLPVIIERDDDECSFEELLSEMNKARQIVAKIQ